MTCFCKWLHFCTDHFMEPWFPATFQTDVASACTGTASEGCSGRVCIWAPSRSNHVPRTQLHLAQAVEVWAQESCVTPRGCRVDWWLGASRGEESHYKKANSWTQFLVSVSLGDRAASWCRSKTDSCSKVSDRRSRKELKSQWNIFALKNDLDLASWYLYVIKQSSRTIVLIHPPEKSIW